MTNTSVSCKQHALTPLPVTATASNKTKTAVILWILALAFVVSQSSESRADSLQAGVAKVDITHLEAGPVNDRLYVKALLLKNRYQTAVIITVDAVAIAEIGSIRNDFLSNVRSRLHHTFQIKPTHVLINASHCHGRVCEDIEDRTYQAVQQAFNNLVPVTIGSGIGHEDRIMENRRLRLKNGTELDVRQAYSLPPDQEIAEIGPVDPEIGVLKLNRMDGATLAVVYQFACHPIQSVPNGGNTADITGFASQVIEDNMSKDTIALFLQGCAGDINPIFYKDVNHPRHAEPLGNMLGLSTLKALRQITPRKDDRLNVLNQVIELPRADLGQRIQELETQQQVLLHSLKGTFLNLKTFLILSAKHNISPEYPSFDIGSYLHDKALGRDDLLHHDNQNRSHLARYIQNIYTMEKLTRLRTNLALLRKHHQTNSNAGSRTISAELIAMRIGDFVLVTFPGELTVQIGLGIKDMSPHPLTFVSGYTNGYLYYSPTAEQLRNVGRAQEDSECLLAPEWQAIYEQQVRELLQQL